MPHITEEIWSSFDNEMLIDNSWPSEYELSEGLTGEVEVMKKLITEIRNFKLTYGLKNSQNIHLYLVEQAPFLFQK